ncbi:MAG: asparagine synthase-related protein, partial [Acidobacteriota bacterium]
KWILRQAVADVLPSNLINRRKAGFDTPAESWIKGIQSGFVHDLLVSPRARNRGIWSVCAIEKLLKKTSHPCWFDIVWKLICIETWARIYLDGELPYSVTDHESKLQTKFIDSTSDKFWQQQLTK